MKPNLNKKAYKVKLCGTTSIRDAQMAVDARADYLGVLVDVPGSERSQSLDEALTIAKSCQIPVAILLSGKSVEEIITIAQDVRPFAVHLLSQMPRQDIQELKERLDCQVWLTVYLPVKGEAEADVDPVKEQMKNYEQAGADLIIIDAASRAVDGTLGRCGGTGKVVDWDAAKELVKSVQVPVFLAGGINPDNVREAILKVDPYGVDLASGVEKSRCNRDPEKVKSFMQIVRSIGT